MIWIGFPLFFRVCWGWKRDIHTPCPSTVNTSCSSHCICLLSASSWLPHVILCSPLLLFFPLQECLVSTEQVDNFFYSFHSLHVIYIWNIIFTFGKEKRREEITFRYLFICERLISSCSSHISYLRCYKMTLEMTHGHNYWKKSYQVEGQKEVVCVCLVTKKLHRWVNLGVSWRKEGGEFEG